MRLAPRSKLTVAEAGRLGGLTTGSSKRRGDRAYYQALARKATAARWQQGKPK